jgi:UDP-N-acetylmuramoyl-tripeptide--D-alanyl-D-alanine ligase
MPGPITGVSNDTRTLRPGDLFFALRGEGADGHDFVAAALAAGASAAVVAAGRLNPLPAGACLEVDDPAAALRRMAAGYRRALDPLMVGVTGSVGKTTVKEMIAEVLASEAPVARTRGNWNNDLGLPLSLLAMPAATRIGVFEIGMNHPGELAPLCRLLQPDWGVVTRIGPVHLEFFESVEAIAREKAVLLQSLPADGLAILNTGDPYFPILRDAAAARVATVAVGRAADYAAVIPDPGGRLEMEERGGRRYAVRVPLPGRHNAENALLALAAGRERGLSPEAIQAALARVRPPPMRWEASDFGGIRLVNDAYNANPMSMRAALLAFAAEPVPGRRWLVLAGMRELGHAEAAEHETLGREVASGAWAGLVTVGARGRLIAEAARAAGMDPGRVAACPDHAAAAAELSRRVRPGDAVLFKASRGERLETVLAFWRGAATREKSA